MKNARLLLAAALFFVAGAAIAQEPIEYTPVSCLRAGESGVLHATVNQPGQLRIYFRRAGTTDWCYVDGQNLGRASTVTLPEFEEGTEIEYFFVLLEGKRVIGRSASIYRLRVTERCDSPFARHSLTLAVDCSQSGPNSIARSVAAGYAAKVNAQPPEISPVTPQQ
jgi:hypothetical protein